MSELAMPTALREYRMSGLGHCPRVLSAMQLGYNPLPEAEFMRLAAREGARHEQWIIEDLVSDGWTISGRQSEVEIAYPALGFRMVGHIEGMAAKGSEIRLLEIKSMSRFRYQSFVSHGFEKFQDYTFQITAYHKAYKTAGVDLPILYIVKDRDSGKKQEIKMDRPPLEFATILAKIITIESDVKKGHLCQAERTEGFVCDQCLYRYLCESETVTEDKELEKISTFADLSREDIFEAARMRRESLELFERADMLKYKADKVLLDLVKKLKGKTIVDDLSLIYVKSSERVSFDSGVLRSIFPEEQLKQAEKRTEVREYVRVTDLRK